MDDKILFSVIIPVYNREKLIRNTIDSVLSQTFQDFELIVIDDGSNDQTLKTPDEYSSHIQILSQSNQGPESARFNGIKNARGEYLVFLDSDDLFQSKTLEIYNRILHKTNYPALLLGAMQRCSSDQIEETLHKLSSARKSISVFCFPDFLSKNISINMSNSKIVIKKTVYNDVYTAVQVQEKGFPIDDFNLLMLSGTATGCAIISEPTTVICGSHEGNTIKNMVRMYTGILAFIAAEKKGRYPGGNRRILDRYTKMSGTIFEYFKIALRQKHYHFAFVLLSAGWPMLMTGILKNILPWQKKRSIKVITSTI